MKVGIDSYPYHRLFGEVYPQQNALAYLGLSFDTGDFARASSC